MTDEDEMTQTPRDPRARRSPFAPRDAAGAAAALEAAADQMRAQQLVRGASGVDEPPTGLLDLAAIRAALGESAPDANPAAVAWLAGDEPEPAPEPEPVPSFDEWLASSDDEAAEALREAVVDERTTTGLEPAPVEHDCAVLPSAFHSDAPCGPTHHPDLEPAADATVPDPEPAPVPPSPEPAPVLAVPPSTPAPVFSSERSAGRPVVDWRSRHDERSRNFGVRARLFGSAPLTDHVLPIGPILDQGEEGACAGAAVAAAANTLELLARAQQRTIMPRLLTMSDAHAIYARAQQLDEVPGESYTGTSVLAAMKAGQEQALWGGYLWDFGTRDVAQTILKLQRPVIVGVRWLTGMYDTGPGGLVQLTGDDEGLGHCLSVFGIRLKGPQGQPGPYFGWQNSWGAGYGDDGIGWVHHRDLAALLHGTGEAAVPTTDPVTPGGVAR